MKLYAEQDENMNLKYYDGDKTILCEALLNNNLPMVELLIHFGAQPLYNSPSLSPFPALLPLRLLCKASNSYKLKYSYFIPSLKHLVFHEVYYDTQNPEISRIFLILASHAIEEDDLTGIVAHYLKSDSFIKGVITIFNDEDNYEKEELAGLFKLSSTLSMRLANNPYENLETVAAQVSAKLLELFSANQGATEKMLSHFTDQFTRHFDYGLLENLNHIATIFHIFEQFQAYCQSNCIGTMPLVNEAKQRFLNDLLNELYPSSDKDISTLILPEAVDTAQDCLDQECNINTDILAKAAEGQENTTFLLK